MPVLKLTYFDLHGGRGEVARLALGGLAFEDERIPVSRWPELRDGMRFRALPVLEVDGQAIAHPIVAWYAAR